MLPEDNTLRMKDFVLKTLQTLAQGKMESMQNIKEEINLVGSGLIDSLGFLEMVSAIEKEFRFEFDFSDLDPAEFTTLKGFVFQATRSLSKSKKER